MNSRPIIFSAPMVRAILAGTKTQTRRTVKDISGLRVRLRERVYGDFPFHRVNARAGVHVPRLNEHGAVSVIDDDGKKLLGVKPSEFEWLCRYGAPGDRLWVRETFCCGSAALPSGFGIIPADTIEPGQKVVYRATSNYAGDEPPWRSPIYMPRWASRLTLEIVDVRVQRLQEISEEDARAEGVMPLQMDSGSFLPSFEGGWDSINGKRAPWSSNPWVWAITFERLSP